MRKRRERKREMEGDRERETMPSQNICGYSIAVARQRLPVKQRTENES